MHNLYLTLVHYPIYDKNGRIVMTSVTNFDLHDLARTARTFGVRRVFILTPSETQRGMVDYIMEYWRNGKGGAYNPDRHEAFSVLACTASLEETCLTIENDSGKRPYLVATSAQLKAGAVSFPKLGAYLRTGDRPVLLAFGTGHGLAQEFLDQCDAVLDPIEGKTGYNHLPVRRSEEHTSELQSQR